ncbi:unnamed protein product [Periconia digitata]|uniref:BTB domain-containing protein n=1 Tax=Periconia digitata TaxID=1303443 RepID=A0A9W4XQN3_9PLEO|nr:unnamed protein product [Periconia digitata]
MAQQNNIVQGAPATNVASSRSFADSPTLSDVTIKFGEHTFHAHKVVLAMKSDWFRAAFCGNFIESGQSEITLHGDDPDALRFVLQTAYEDTWTPETGGIPFLLRVYRVSAKYQLESTKKKAMRFILATFRRLLRKIDQKGDEMLDDFMKVMLEIYDGEEPLPAIAEDIIDVLCDQSPGVFSIRSPNVHKAVVDTSKQIAAFAQDMLPKIMLTVGNRDTSPYSSDLSY